MKHFIYVLLVISMLMSLSSFTANAEWYNELTFIVASDTEVPITVTYDGKSYSVNSSLAINTIGNLYSPSATDINGNPLKYEGHYTTKTKGPDTYHYHIYTFYGNSYDSQYDTPSQSMTQAYDDNIGGGSKWADVGRGLSCLNGLRAADIDGKAYPGLHLYTGLSKAYEEFIRLRAVWNVIYVFGGIGKDWLFNGVNKNKLLWHAGFGGLYHFDANDPWGDIAGAITIARTAAWEKVSLMIGCDFTYWFGKWRRVGCFAGAGFGLADISDFGKENAAGTKFARNLEVGLNLRIAHFYSESIMDS